MGEKKHPQSAMADSFLLFQKEQTCDIGFASLSHLNVSVISLGSLSRHFYFLMFRVYLGDDQILLEMNIHPWAKR